MPTISPSDLEPSDEPAVDDDQPRLPPLPADVETRLLDVLRRPLHEDEGHAAGHRAKELELRAALITLGAVEAFTVQRRIERADPADELAAQFHRMLPERRSRLLALLAEIRRRHATFAP